MQLLTSWHNSYFLLIRSSRHCSHHCVRFSTLCSSLLSVFPDLCLLSICFSIVNFIADFKKLTCLYRLGNCSCRSVLAEVLEWFLFAVIMLLSTPNYTCFLYRLNNLSNCLSFEKKTGFKLYQLLFF